MVNSIKKNASFVFPRLGLLVVLLWLLWFVNSVIQNTWMVLLKQVRLLLGLASSFAVELHAWLKPVRLPC